MKRRTLLKGKKKLRDRRTGKSPYQRYSKTPHAYSQAYRDWRRNRLRSQVPNEPSRVDLRGGAFA